MTIQNYVKRDLFDKVAKHLSNKEISDEEIYLNNQIVDQINNLKS